MTSEPYRHNSWARQRLLDFCRDLDPAVLDAAVPGTYGSIKETLAHLIASEESLAAMVEGSPVDQPQPRFTSLDDLQERARRLSDRWERMLGLPLHPERLVERDRRGGERRLVRLGSVLAQVVHHGNHHRAEICVALSSVGVVPPTLDGWAYGAWVIEHRDRQGRRGDI